MSYIFSRVLVEEFLGANCSASAPSAPSNLNPTQQAYCSPARMTAYSRLSRYGMTYAPLTDDRGEALLTWYLEASLARTFQLREKARALTAPAPACGGKCTELSMRYDRNSHSWKTHLCLWEEDLPESSVTLPKSGTMRNGLCWERTMWEPRMSGNASGYLLAQEREIWPTPRAGKSSSENPESWLARYAAGKVSTPPLGLAVKFATPQARDFRTGESNRWDNPHRSRNLNDQIAKYPTPRTKGMCGGTGSFQKMKSLEDQGIITTDERKQMTAGNGGQLNPTWVEWLIGWPLEWTALKPLATDKFRQWRQLHSGFCSNESKKERRTYEACA